MRMDKVIRVLEVYSDWVKTITVKAGEPLLQRDTLFALTQAQSAQKVIDAVGKLFTKGGMKNHLALRNAYAEYKSLSVNGIKQSDSDNKNVEDFTTWKEWKEGDPTPFPFHKEGE
jgi:hypothetical protein